MSKIALRNFWFQFHKWIGLILAIAIIPICVTGAALVWHDALDEALNPVRHASSAAPALTPSAYVAAAKADIGADQRVAQIIYPEEGKGSVRLVLANPPVPGERRPVRTNIWLDPVDGHVLDTARSDQGAVRVMHVLHGSLYIPEWGRPIVGWVGVAMVISCVSGIWLWWPTIGSWVRGLRWRRHNNFDTNLHHLFGFWIAIPLFILSLTGVWISFPKVFSAFDSKPAAEKGEAKGESKGGENKDKAKGKGDGKGAAKGGGGRQAPAQPLATPALGVDKALAAAQAMESKPFMSITWPTEKAADWEFKTGGKPNTDNPPRTIKVADVGGAASLKAEEPPARGPVMRLMRQIHDGTDTGFVWQFIIFLGGLLPAILSITGLIMWWRARKWKSDLKQRKRARAAG